MVFNIFVLMQLFNQINARKLFGELNSFTGILENSVFLIIMGLELGGQIFMVQVGGVVFKTPDGLTAAQWGWSLLFGSGELLWHFVVCSTPPSWIPDFIVNFDKKLNSTPEEDEEATKAKAANTTKKEPVRRGSSFLAAQNAAEKNKTLKGAQPAAARSQTSPQQTQFPEGTPAPATRDAAP